jgi:hypothetical protein
LGRQRIFSFERGYRLLSCFLEAICGLQGQPMLYKLGRFFQLIGMIFLPVGIAGNLAREDVIDLKTSLAISGAGIGIFAIGWLLQQAGKNK